MLVYVNVINGVKKYFKYEYNLYVLHYVSYILFH